MRGSDDARGNFIGYSSACENMRSALLSQGWEEHEDADLAVHFCFPTRFQPIPGKRNAIFTMFENPRDHHALGNVFKPALDAADLVIVPSRFCLDLFREWTETPIEVCPLGVDPDLYPYKRRVWNKARSPFVWLYVGAANTRKFTILPQLWEQMIGHPDMRGTQLLYFKTTGLELERWPGGIETLRQSAKLVEYPTGPVFKGPGFILDGRKLPAEQLRQVYYIGNAFLFTHCGEGWGMTGHEALATGCPLVVSDYSGTQEYADRTNAYPVRMTDVRIDLEPDPESPGAPEVYEGKWPDPSHALDQMCAILSDYKEALRRAHRGSERAKLLSWRAAGATLSRILRAASG